MFSSPPEHFAIVSKNIYRSSTFSSNNYDYIKSLNLSIVILLSPESPSKSLLTFLDSNKITLHHLGLNQSWNSWHPISEDAVKEGLEYLIKLKAPALIMCSSGIHETGTFFK
jgi:tyrosine-protein phosphatase SIW14